MKKQSLQLGRWQAMAVAALLALGLVAGTGLAVEARTPPGSFADQVENLTPAVVNISTTQSRRKSRNQVPIPQFPPGSPFGEFFERQRPEGDRQPHGRPATSLGSGFIIAASGVIVTNNHVIDGADEITVILSDGKSLEAKVLGVDKKTDLAVLQVEAGRPLPFVEFGNSDTSRVGDWVVAIGNPFGLGGTVTAGIISARARVLRSGPYDDFIQTDASINSGNSGGPLFNTAGQVIGINTAIFSTSGGNIGIGFAVPANLARPVIAQLRDLGHTVRGWLGVKIQPVSDEIAESLGLEAAGGALLAEVTPNGPAAKAGLEVGDVILEFDAKKVSEMRLLPRLVAETEVGRSVVVRVWRRGAMVDLAVEIGELEEARVAARQVSPPRQSATATATVDVLGMKLAAMSGELRQRFELDKEAQGVVVTAIDAASPAAEKGVRAGDVIVEVARQEVGSPGQVLDKVREVRKSQRKSVLLLVRRAENQRFVPLRLEDS